MATLVYGIIKETANYSVAGGFELISGPANTPTGNRTHIELIIKRENEGDKHTRALWKRAPGGISGRLFSALST